jgi:hypothetical protein
VIYNKPIEICQAIFSNTGGCSKHRECQKSLGQRAFMGYLSNENEAGKAHTGASHCASLRQLQGGSCLYYKDDGPDTAGLLKEHAYRQCLVDRNRVQIQRLRLPGEGGWIRIVAPVRLWPGITGRNA